MNTTIDFEQAWQAVVNRDRSQDGSFFFAVRTTGVYCRPSCPARRPRTENVTFFTGPDEAERAGYRACLRCRPRDEVPAAERLVADAKELIDSAPEEAAGLADLAATLAVSAGHLQRTFKRLTGLSPRQYAEALRLQRFKQGLRQGHDVASATYEAGYGSSSRVYEQANKLLGMTPGAYRRGGRGMTIAYTLAESPLGPLLVASTECGVCFVGFGKDVESLEQDLHQEYPLAEIPGPASSPDQRALAVLAFLTGRCQQLDFPLDLQGSQFQLLVWQALRSIPYGATRSYGEIAEVMGKPKAARAVARACASNPVALAVPCHRVVANDGGASGYRWGVTKKATLLETERRVAAEGR